MNSILLPVFLLIFSVAFFVQELDDDKPSKLNAIVYIFAVIFAYIAMFKMCGWLDLNVVNAAG